MPNVEQEGAGQSAGEKPGQACGGKNRRRFGTAGKKKKIEKKYQARKEGGNQCKGSYGASPKSKANRGIVSNSARKKKEKRARGSRPARALDCRSERAKRKTLRVGVFYPRQEKKKKNAKDGGKILEGARPHKLPWPMK